MSRFVRAIRVLAAILVSALPCFAQHKNATMQDRLERVLADREKDYDPAVHMLREPLKSPGYHTTLKTGTVHSTRTALCYAVALLDAGGEARLQRACDVLKAVIALQDQDPASKTYGIWSWFQEEPLAKMSPPDWNWADFCGVQLLQVALRHRERLPPDVARAVDESIRHAARSIQRRNVGPGYTNIAIMGTYVTLVAAEFYGWPDLKDYAVKRLAAFHAYTKTQGAFTEYNSPTYSMVALMELARMQQHVKDAPARVQIDELYRMVWEDIAAHFHAPTWQWAGPHSRCYSTLLKSDALDRLQAAMGGRVNFGVDAPSLVDTTLIPWCPADLVTNFQRLESAREVVRTYEQGVRPVVGTTWLEPAFTLGSINRGDFWNQRRPLVAYWGTARSPSYLQVRVLRDGYDFASARFFSAQRGGDVLGAVVFVTDGGNTHTSLDRIKNGIVRAKDFRLRFEFGGAAGAVRPGKPSRLDLPCTLRWGDVQLSVAVPYAAFGAANPAWDAGQGEGRAWLDVVLYSGEDREFRFAELDRAALGLTVRMRAGEDATASAVAVDTQRPGQLGLCWNGLRVNVPLRPGRGAELMDAGSSRDPVSGLAAEPSR